MMRNKATALQRKDNIDQSVKRMEEAKNPSEINDINKPKDEQTWKLIEDDNLNVFNYSVMGIECNR